MSRSYSADGKPYTVSADGSTWTYLYNNRRLLYQETLNYQGSNLVIGHGFDANAHVASLTYPDGLAVAFNPNALGEPTAAGSAATGVSYSPDGSVAGFTYGNGIVHSQTENARDLPYQNTDSGVLSDQYAYDQDGSVTGITDNQAGITTRAFQYDGLRRLITANAPNVWGSGGYTYDPLDNIRTSLIGSRNSTHNYSSTTNQLTSIVNSSGTTNYQFDARGNASSRGAQQFTFDLGNRIQSAPGVDTFHYDGWFRRTNVTQSNGTYQIWVYSHAGQLLYLAQSGGPGGSQNVDYLYLGNRIVAESGSAGTFYLHTDVQGSPVKTTNAARAVVSSTTYEPYGNTAAGTVPTTVGYTGHVNDPELGLVYMQARYYDPIAARFLSVDPDVTDPLNGGMFNRYSYAEDNPIDRVDPSGLRWVDVYIWNWSGESVGHVMMTEHLSTKVLLSQFPADGLPWGHNIQKDFYQTLEAEKRAPNSAWAVFVPDDKAFDAAVARELSLSWWTWNPSDRSTQCSIAASRALRSSGVNLTSIIDGTLLPGAFARNLAKNQNAHGNKIQSLPGALASALGYDSVTVSSNGSVTGKYTPQGSHITRTVTCDAKGCK